MKSYGLLTIASGLLTVTGLVGAQGVDGQAVLDQAKREIASIVRNAPRYACMETIQRSWYANRKPVRPGCETDRAPDVIPRDLLRSDRLRLDVAVGSDQEMFSWHGEQRFRTDEIDKIVTSGPISSGTYFLFLHSIFLEGNATVYFRGTRADGPSAEQFAEFEYTVPLDRSKFETKTEAGRAFLAYHGTFTVALATSEIRSLRIVADDLPVSSRMCAFDLLANYLSVTLGESAFRLPSSVVMNVLDVNHEYARTLTNYSECHQFVGESKLRFNQSATGSTSGERTVVARLPSRTRIDIAIRTNVNPETAWAGDPINGRVTENVEDAHGTIIIPVGALVHGRLLRIEEARRPTKFYSVALACESITVGDTKYVLDITRMKDPVMAGRSTRPLRERLELDNSINEEASNICHYRLTKTSSPLKGRITQWMTN